MCNCYIIATYLKCVLREGYSRGSSRNFWVRQACKKGRAWILAVKLRKSPVTQQRLEEATHRCKSSDKAKALGKSKGEELT